MKFTNIENVIHEFYCPYHKNENLTLKHQENNGELIISSENKNYKIIDNIIEFCSLNELQEEPHKLREVEGIDKAHKQYQGAALVGRWNDYILHLRMVKLKLLIEELFQDDVSTLVFLGSGAGTEITQILEMDKNKKIKRVLASDISLNACKISAQRLEKYDIEATIFSSDLDYCPVKKNTNYPIVIIDALHHTPDMHKSIEKLLAYGYKNIYFVEPTNNLIIKLLEKFGLARRMEYSGLIPGRLEIERLKTMAKEYQYSLKINTIWEFPADYYRKLFGSLASKKTVEKLFLSTIDAISYVTNFIKSGNSSIVHLKKKNV
jgi:hypothetical protein